MRDRAVLIVAGSLWLACLLGAGGTFFSMRDGETLILKTVRFGSALLIALAYVSIGATVWHWVIRRSIALSLGAFCWTMAITFAGETASVQGDHLFSAITGVSSSFAFLLFAVLLFQFPCDIRNRATSALSCVLVGLCAAG